MNVVGAARSTLAKHTFEIVAIAVVYISAAEFGFTMAFATRQVTAVWAPLALARIVSWRPAPT